MVCVSHDRWHGVGNRDTGILIRAVRNVVIILLARFVGCTERFVSAVSEAVFTL
jgi:hypothetical protein